MMDEKFKTKLEALLREHARETGFIITGLAMEWRLSADIGSSGVIAAGLNVTADGEFYSRVY